MNNNNILCDHKCPLHENCARYLEGIDRSKTFHVDPVPYKDGKCFLFTPLTEDDVIDKVNKIVNRRMN
jgi:hypothetical protein